MASEFKVGSVEGTGSAINVPLGFQPDFVMAVNIDGGAPTLFWINGMAAGDALKLLSIDDDGTSGNSSSALITSGGIDAYAGSSSEAEGFTIGADSDVNANGETILYVAARSSNL